MPNFGEIVTNCRLPLEREIWDLEAKKYHIMLAVGKVEDNQLRYHDKKVFLHFRLREGGESLIEVRPVFKLLMSGAPPLREGIFNLSLRLF